MTKIFGKKVGVMHLIVVVLVVVAAFLLIQLGYGNLAKTQVVTLYSSPPPEYFTCLSDATKKEAKCNSDAVAIQLVQVKAALALTDSQARSAALYAASTQLDATRTACQLTWKNETDSIWKNLQLYFQNKLTVSIC